MMMKVFILKKMKEIYEGAPYDYDNCGADDDDHDHDHDHEDSKVFRLDLLSLVLFSLLF